MKNSTKISIIMPIYNVAMYLERSIKSLLSQTFNIYEIILVDDGSIDGSQEIIKKYSKKNSKIKMVFQNNNGVGSARNKGLDIATGDYIYFMDPDDWIDKNLFNDNVKLLEKNKPDVLIFGWFDHYNGNVFPSKFDGMFLQGNEKFVKNFSKLFRQGILYTVWNKLYKRSFLEGNGIRFGYERSGEDYLFNIKTWYHLNSILVNNAQYYHYYIWRQGSETQTFNYDIFDLYKHEQLYLLKFMKEKQIVDNSLIDDRWFFILFSTWKRSLSLNSKTESNQYMEVIINEFKKNKYISIKNLSGLKAKLKYFLLFKLGMYKLSKK